MADLQVAYEWAVNTCNMANPYALYTQNTDSTKGPTRYGGIDSEGNVYYDCSSFISAALTQGGFFSSNPWFATSNMRTYLSKAGFTKVSMSDTLKAGDICWKSGHTEMIYAVNSDNKILTMGAHTAKAAKANQVSIGSSRGERPYIVASSRWTEIYRFTGQEVDPENPDKPFTPVDPEPDIPTTPVNPSDPMINDPGDLYHPMSTIVMLKMLGVINE